MLKRYNSSCSSKEGKEAYRLVRKKQLAVSCLILCSHAKRQQRPLWIVASLRILLDSWTKYPPLENEGMSPEILDHN